jgi:ribosome recycling factor
MAELSTIDNILSDANDRMHKSVLVFEREIIAIRTGRATTSLLDGVTVEYYGTVMPLNQMATIAAPEARLLTIQPWDRKALPAIEKEILKSDLGLTPQNDGTIIRVPIPALTEERRGEFVKRLKRLLEDKHVAVRNIRRDSLDQLRHLEKDGRISEDDLRRAQDRLQKLTDEQIARADKVSANKETALMEV